MYYIHNIVYCGIYRYKLIVTMTLVDLRLDDHVSHFKPTSVYTSIQPSILCYIYINTLHATVVGASAIALPLLLLFLILWLLNCLRACEQRRGYQKVKLVSVSCRDKDNFVHN